VDWRISFQKKQRNVELHERKQLKRPLKRLNSKPTIKKLLLIGKKLEHSFSPIFFEKKFSNENLIGWQYYAHEIDNISKVEALRKDESIIGFNVTIPYKSAILPYLDELSDEAKEIGAVNTVVVLKQEGNTKLVGYNTDKSAFEETLVPFLDQIKGAMILGTGGAAKAVKSALKYLKIKTISISRQGETTYAQISRTMVESYNLIINCTPLGMFPDNDSCPDIPYRWLNANHILYDLVYNPVETTFLMKGAKKNCKTLNGQKMLELQAELAFSLWNEVKS